MDRSRITRLGYRAIERLLGRPLTWRLGRWLYLGARRDVANDARFNGEYALLASVAARCAGNAAFFDVGACVGDWTAALRRALRDRAATCRVHLFEPVPTHHRQLQQRFADGIAARSVHTVAMALAGSEGEALFHVRQPGISSLTDLPCAGAAEHVRVKTTTVDAYMTAHHIERVELIKVDTEGSDLEVILGARGALRDGRVGLLQFEYNWRWIPAGHTLWEVFSLAKETGYLLGKVTPGRIEFYRAWHPELDRFVETNFVMARPEKLAGIPHVFMAFDHSNVARERSASDA